MKHTVTWNHQYLPIRTKKREGHIQGIYCIEIPEMKCCYIGQSVNVYGRWYQHKHTLNRGTCEMKDMQMYWNKHKDLFVFRVLEATDISSPDLLQKERDYAEKYLSDGYTLFNNYFYVKPKNVIVSEDHLPLITKILRLISKGRLDVNQMDQYLDTL